MERISDFAVDAEASELVDSEDFIASSTVEEGRSADAAPGDSSSIRRFLPGPELSFTGALLLLTLGLGGMLGFPFSMPSGERAAFVGIHYLYPLVGLAIWGVIAAIGQRRDLARTFLIALPCYAVVLVCHFNLKLWGPFINPMMWDDFYWRTDTWLRPVVDGCIALRHAIAPLVPLDSNLYMVGFIAMFYLSFCVHALRGAHQFRTLFLAALLFQGMGALAYLVAPAIGPFLYEPGIEPMQTMSQQGMLGVRQDMLAGGADWIATYGGIQITTGLAAMPSLHTGGSFLFLLFAWRYARTLVPIYVVLFGYIAIDAVASRWHYVVDLPAGVALALACAWAAERLNRQPAAGPAGATSTHTAS